MTSIRLSYPIPYRVCKRYNRLTSSQQAAIAAAGSASTESFTVTIADTNGPATGTETLSFTTALPPVVTAGATASYTDGAAATAVDSGLTVSDSSTTTLFSATVSIANGFVSGDVLSTATQGGINVAYNSGTGVLSLSGAATLAEYQSVLDGVTFSTGTETVGAHLSAAPADETRTLDYTVTDGMQSSTLATSTVDVGIVIADTAANIAGAFNTSITTPQSSRSRSSTEGR